jgi:hypothetical protein
MLAESSQPLTEYSFGMTGKEIVYKRKKKNRERRKGESE